MDGRQCAELLALVRRKRPLVHHITNKVTINDCANITLCTGASPVMAEAPEEAADMAAIAGALVLNIGTLTSAQVDSMVLAGSRANALGIPVILDPVGVGATRMRTAAVLRLIEETRYRDPEGKPGRDRGNLGSRRNGPGSGLGRGEGRSRGGREGMRQDHRSGCRDDGRGGPRCR